MREFAGRERWLHIHAGESRNADKAGGSAMNAGYTYMLEKGHPLVYARFALLCFLQPPEYPLTLADVPCYSIHGEASLWGAAG